MAIAGRSGSRRALDEDGWSVLIGLVIVTLCLWIFRAGYGPQAVTIVPRHWNSVTDLLDQLGSNMHWYARLGLTLMVFFTAGAVALGAHVVRFAAGFLVLFTLVLAALALAAWEPLVRVAVEPPIIALLGGVVLGNLVALPAWLREAMRAELYLKAGVVLLGATAPLTLLRGVSPGVIVQVSVVAIVTFVTIYGIARFLDVDRRLGAMLAAGASACGIPTVLAVAGAVRAKRQDVSIATMIVFGWSLAMVVLQPLLARAWYLPAGPAGAWIGTLESTDAAGLAAVQVYGEFLKSGSLLGKPEQVLLAYTIVKTVGRDLWIGLWAVSLSFYAVLRWEPNEGGATGPGQAWVRFPKYIVGFVVASVLVSWITGFAGAIQPGLLEPLGALRDLTFALCFMSIGASVPLRNLAPVGGNAFIAVATGVVANLIFGFILAALVFGDYWTALSL